MSSDKQISLFETQAEYQADGLVECLGMTFANDAERRAYFTEELRKKLQDPEFRKIEGFPIGDDEDILALSDPPYYTACPNPWIAGFVTQWEADKPPKPEECQYHREPFAADVSEGKNDPIYNAHSYHTKVPHKAIMRYILHYTEPGDIVFDGFCGTGMTGVAAQMCGSRQVVESLGYRVEADNSILREDPGEDGRKRWVAFSKLGVRQAVLNDLSPAATFIAYNYNTPVDVAAFETEARCILKEVQKECRWMYETKHRDGISEGIINFVVWSEINTCSECGESFVFYDEARDIRRKKVRNEFECPHCGALLKKRKLEVTYENVFDARLNKVIKLPKRIPVLINYSVGKKKFQKKPDSNDLATINRIQNSPNLEEIPATELPDMQMMRVGRMKSSAVTHIHHFYLSRPSRILGMLWKKANAIHTARLRALLKFWLDSHLVNLSIRNRYRPEVSFPYNPLTGVFYVPSIVSEPNVLRAYSNKSKRIHTALSSLPSSVQYPVQTCSASAALLPANSQDYIFTDPPFGENIYYSDLNYFVESWYGVFTNAHPEAIVDRVREKDLSDYQKLMRDCFREYHRVLKPGHWMTVEFSNSKASVWNVIQTALQDVGFVVGNVATLDKQQRSFQSVTSPIAVKQDLVISAYKPNGGFEARFPREASCEEGVWDFVRTHLTYLPVVKQQNGVIQMVPERDSRILFDQMVAYYVRKGYAIPLSSQEFQLGLTQRFSERDGMYFLPAQAAEYDRKRISAERIIQVPLFVDDESSAIQWLRQLLKEKPQTFSDINPQFMQQLGGWRKNEQQMDLRDLLQLNFLMYDNKGPVPEQIHAYLSSNWKEMRNLAKDDPALVAKAKNRWYVPDPNKAADLEKLRERGLLREFETYKASKQRRLKLFRLEAVRAGFKKAWQENDYDTIIGVARKIPNNVLQEDPKLLMWYDAALTRTGQTA